MYKSLAIGLLWVIMRYLFPGYWREKVNTVVRVRLSNKWVKSPFIMIICYLQIPSQTLLDMAILQNNPLVKQTLDLIPTLAINPLKEQMAIKTAILRLLSILPTIARKSMRHNRNLSHRPDVWFAPEISQAIRTIDIFIHYIKLSRINITWTTLY